MNFKTEKFVLGILTIGLLSLSFTSCKKNDSPIPQGGKTANRSATTEGVSVSSDGYLVFASEDVYEAKLQELALLSDEELDVWEKSLGYSSLRHALGVETADNAIVTENRTAEDNLFRTIINEQGMIQVGNYLFKAAIDKGFVSEINASETECLDRFKAGEFIANISNRFDLDEDDVFTKLDDGLAGSNKGNKIPIFGTGDKYNDDQNSGDGFIYRADTKLAYQKAVFYFSLVGELKFMWRATNHIFWDRYSTPIDIELKYCDYSWQNKKNHTGSNSAYYQLSHTTNNKLNYRPYSGSRGLTKYSMKAHFYYNGILNQWTGPTNMRMVPYNFYIHS